MRTKTSRTNRSQYLWILLVILSFFVCIPTSLYAQKNEKRQLKKYYAAGVEKKVSTKGTTPKKIIETSKTYLGTKHRMGGTSHKGMDCSGLIYVSFQKNGIQLPRTSTEQGRYGKQIKSISHLKKGDLVFFHMNWNTKRFVNHVGIYLGNGDFIHVSSSKGCIVSSLKSDYWEKGFVFGTRVW